MREAATQDSRPFDRVGPYSDVTYGGTTRLGAKRQEDEAMVDGAKLEGERRVIPQPKEIDVREPRYPVEFLLRSLMNQLAIWEWVEKKKLEVDLLEHLSPDLPSIWPAGDTKVHTSNRNPCPRVLNIRSSFVSLGKFECYKWTSDWGVDFKMGSAAENRRLPAASEAQLTS
ncbi:hypothetical protein C8R44DRAFT_724847 [Mycena epipterygia]|nr:hypothetical protein C8R44DRAFT_724847 [Mycena epipterygia]